MSAAARTPSPQCSAAAPQEATDERPFEIPDWLVDNTSPAPVLLDTSDVDPHRVEDLVNRFIAGKQDALFLAPDAYYRTGGRDAVDGVPDIVDRLDDLRNTTLQAAGDEATRFMLAPRLDAHLDDARYGIDRHVTAQHDALTRQIIGERQRLIQHAAELEHNNGDKLAGLAEAHASAAQELARMNGEPEAAAMDAARSAIWRTAIDQRLGNGNGPQAIDLFDQVKNQIAPDDHLSLDGPLQVARNDQAANQWIANQTGTDGPSLQDRAAADPALPPDTKLIVRAKLDARDSAEETAAPPPPRHSTTRSPSSPGFSRPHLTPTGPERWRRSLTATTMPAHWTRLSLRAGSRCRKPFSCRLRRPASTGNNARSTAFPMASSRCRHRHRSPQRRMHPRATHSPGRALRMRLLLPRFPASNEAAVASGQANTTQVADSRKEYCLERCSDQILMLPFSKRPGTFDQCMAHCEGRTYFHQIQPLIPFPGGGK